MKIPDQGLRRRAFLHRSMGLLMAAHPGVAVLGSLGGKADVTSPLKPESQYRTEALAYESAMNELAQFATMPVGTSLEIQRASALVDRAIPNLDQCFSWMVMAFVSDPAFVAGVKGRVHDQATFKSLVRDLLRDPNAVMSIPGASAVRSQFSAQATLRQQRLTTAHKRVRDLITNLPDVKEAKTNTKTQSEGIEEAKRRAQAQKDAACAQAGAAIVAALVIIVAAIVVATVTSGVTKGDVDAAAIDLASAYQDEGGSALRRCLDAANEHYRTRIKSIPKTVTSLERQQAVLQYQAAWLAEKSGCEGWAPV